ncbi:hypothetical protein CYMTET_42483 [Cymbomonas tetramitiformis]|uniref:Uncharacterized protein n=1 Tax=Cymbomonas tetramitiformis TaxID=36881 RepID=A0AAE0C664_9CHLO|nr:hypothetical protein CYMTET_42483 [Cymbomonas tetramitiformis]
MHNLYLAAQRAYPRTVAAGTGFAVMGLGDASVQALLEPKLDFHRNLVSSTYNGLISPIFYSWYAYMDRIWPPKGLRFASLMRKVLVNQIVLTSINTPVYMAWCHHVEAALAGPCEDWAAVHASFAEHARLELPGLLCASFGVWIPSNTINFLWVPQHLKIPFISAFSVAWGGFLSMVVHRQTPPIDPNVVTAGSNNG